MTALVEALYQTKYNPFKYGEFLASFYSELTGVKENLLLSQLVIPLCSHPVFSKKLSRAVFGNSRRSTTWTIFKDRKELFDLQERIDGFQELTTESLQYCLINDWLEIDSDKLEIRALNSSNIHLKKQKSAEKLGKLFSQLSVIEIYALLGVKPR